MIYASPITDEDRRRRHLKGEVLEDGEHLRWNIHMMDSAPANVADYQHIPADQRETAMAYDAMVADLTERRSRPAASDNATAAAVASAYDEMIADLHRNAR